MENPFLRKLGHGADLKLDDHVTLMRGLGHVRTYPADSDIIVDGDKPDDVRLVMEGMACRSKTLPGGDRAIMALLLPGDFCDLHVAILGQMDHTISTLTPCRVVSIPKSTIEAWTEHHPRINRALWWATLVDEAVLRAWLINLGARRGPERIAHLICELQLRLETVGLATADGFLLPLTQLQLGEATGLSVVHVNRMLTELRTADLVTFKFGRVTIPDVKRLSAMAGFDPSYLHLQGSSSRGDMTRGELTIADLEAERRLDGSAI